MKDNHLPRPERRMLTTEEAADYCGLSVNSFRAYVRVPPVNFGRSVRYDRKQVDEWLDRFRRPITRNKPVWELAGNNRERPPL